MDALLEPFLALAAESPDRLLLSSPLRSLTAGETAARAHMAAGCLRRLRLPAGSVIGLAAPSGPSFVVAFLALRLAGHCALLVDSATPDAEKARIAESLGAAMMWHLSAEWPEGDWLGEMEPIASAHRLSLPQAAALKLTSGSTGAPAGIAVSAEALCADTRALWRAMGLRREDRFLAALPMSHSYGFSLLPMSCLLEGAALVCPADEDPLRAGRELGATVFPSVPSWFQTQLEFADPQPWPESLRLLVSAGAPLLPETAAKFRRRFGTPIHVLYGSSECGGIAYDRTGSAAERGTVGAPIDGVDVRLEEEKDGRGVVSVRSAAVATGYVPADRDASGRLAAGRFVTEDVASFMEGELVLHGRKGDWINVKGKKVNPREVEAVLLEMPGVLEAAVLGHSLPDGRGECVRAVVACPGGGVGYGDVTRWCRARLAAHKVPRSVIVVPRIPRTERGKWDRRALLALKPESGAAAD